MPQGHFPIREYHIKYFVDTFFLFEVKAVDVEPIDSRYWIYLQPVGAAWTVETIYALVKPRQKDARAQGEEVNEQDMKTAAVAQKTTLIYPQWDGRRAKLPDQSVHMAMLADDALSRIEL